MRSGPAYKPPIIVGCVHVCVRVHVCVCVWGGRGTAGRNTEQRARPVPAWNSFSLHPCFSQLPRLVVRSSPARYSEARQTGCGLHLPPPAQNIITGRVHAKCAGPHHAGTYCVSARWLARLGQWRIKHGCRMDGWVCALRNSTARGRGGRGSAGGQPVPLSSCLPW